MNSCHHSEETHRWPHTKTMRMTSFELKVMQNWLAENCEHSFYIDVHRRGYTSKTGEYAVIVFCRDLEIWPSFLLAWT